MRRYANFDQYRKGGQAKETKVGPIYSIVMKGLRLQEFLQGRTQE